MLAPENVDKLLKYIQKETGLVWYWHETVVEPYPIGVAHKIVCEFPVRGGGTRHKWFEVQDILLYTYPELIIEYLKEEINKAMKGNKEYKTEVITHGNCMMCGKELTEGLFLCKECENKVKEDKEN